MNVFVPRSLAHALPALAVAGICAGCSGATGSSPAQMLPSQSAAPAPQRTAAARPSFSATEFFNGISANANPRGVTSTSSDIYFTEYSANKIARITPKGVVKEFALPAGTAPGNLVQGADGNLWYTQAGDTIGRMTPRGKLTQFSVGNEAYGPFDITEGSDGNAWFTFRSPSTNAIGRITTSGVSTLFTAGLSPGDVAVHDITAGPDGNIWFTEEFANQIGRITTSGTITEFSAGISANANLVDITGGPDGNLWFSELGLDKIGRITPSGVVTEFSAGITPGAKPGSMTSAYGYVWFCETGTDELGRISTSGAVTEFALPSVSCNDITYGRPRNALWITDFTGNGMVRVSTP
jgi:virginiamycin B lyase